MARRENCRCEEGFVKGARLKNDTHDCDYVEARNKLIKSAEARASQLFKSYSQKAQWSRAFHNAMNELACETGLTKTPLRPEGAEYVVPVGLKQLDLKKFGN